MSQKPEVGQVWLTESGRRVRILATDVKDDSYPVIAASEYGDSESIESYRADGKYNRSGEPHEMDLVCIAPKRITVERWINIAMGSNGETFTYFYHRKIDAEIAINDDWKVLARAVPFKWIGELHDTSAATDDKE